MWEGGSSAELAVAAGGVESQLRPTDRSVGPVVLGVVTHPCFLGQTGRE